jgi:hypothetical protein
MANDYVSKKKKLFVQKLSCRIKKLDIIKYREIWFDNAEKLQVSSNPIILVVDI